MTGGSHWSAEQVGDATLVALVVADPLALWTVNAERSRSMWEHRRSTAYVRDLWEITALPISRQHRFSTVHVSARPYQRRRPLADTGNHYPAVKAAIDGLVDAGVLPGDTPDVVLSITMHAPQVGTEVALALTLTGVPA